MKSFLPDITSRSHTPYSKRNSVLKPPLAPNSNKSLRNISVGPLSTRNSRHDSSDSFSNPRAISDELVIHIEKDSFITRMLSVRTNKPQKSRILFKPKNLRSCSEVISALFSIHNCDGRILANTLISLFISLGLTDSPEMLSDIFKGISEGLTLNIISYSKKDLIQISEDIKTENLLKRIMKETAFVPGPKINNLISTLQKWWSRLDKRQNGTVPFDDIINFLSDVGAVETSSDIKRMFLKISQSGNYKQFFSVFCKSLLKFLLQEISALIEESDQNVSADIAIMEVRRKVILNSLNNKGTLLSTVADINSSL